MKTGTRRYAKRQTSWIRNQLLPAVRQAQARGEQVHPVSYTHLRAHET